MVLCNGAVMLCCAVVQGGWLDYNQEAMRSEFVFGSVLAPRINMAELARRWIHGELCGGK